MNPNTFIFVLSVYMTISHPFNNNLVSSTSQEFFNSTLQMRKLSLERESKIHTANVGIAEFKPALSASVCDTGIPMAFILHSDCAVSSILCILQYLFCILLSSILHFPLQPRRAVSQQSVNANMPAISQSLVVDEPVFIYYSKCVA